ncbi:hypothetical protein ACE193_12700 [Bernardetia sp. OM2101]|uniref:hypothetical protein n=1 Tax=Bernardetia sp. OM2101 TaxID=3344876 RepID=UPI0035CFB71A
MHITKLLLLFSTLFVFLFSCQTTSENTIEIFTKKFEGDWKLARLTGKRGVADSIVAKFPVTLNVEDTTFLFRQATQYGGTTYRNWIFEDSILLLPYRSHLMGEDTLNFKVLSINEKTLILQRNDSIRIGAGFDTLYFERY